MDKTYEGVPDIGNGFLYSGNTHKAKARVDYTVRYRGASQVGRPILMIPGYLGINQAYDGPRDALAHETGRPVATMIHSRTEIGLGWLTIDKLLHPAKLGPQSVVAMIDELCARFEAKKVTLIGHSMGGPDAIDAALRRPDKVDQIICMGSGGLEAGQNMLRLAGRMPEIIRDEIAPGVSTLAARGDAIKTAGQVAYHALRNPWRTAGEALHISNRQLMTFELGQLAIANIGTHALQFSEDHFFPLEAAIRDAKPLVDTFTVMYNADHLAPQTQPERTAQFLAGILLSQEQGYSVA